MGQKANPIDIRLGITTTWPSKWFADGKNYAKYLHQDLAIRKYLEEKLKDASIARIEIERGSSITTIGIYSSKPGVIIGRSGTAIEDLKKELYRIFRENFDVNIKEVKNPDLDARILADGVARQIEKRVAFRRAAKSAIQRATESGAKGIKIQLGGRLAGADIARTELFKEGNIPLHTFRADISYAADRAETTYGTIGVKVWVYRGDVFKTKLGEKTEEVQDSSG